MDKLFIYRLLLFILEWLAAFSGLLKWRNMPVKHWRLFVIYLFIVALTESGAEIHYYFTKDAFINAAVYNSFLIPLQFIFFFWLFYRELNPVKQSHWPLICALVYFVGWVSDYFYMTDKEFAFQSFSYTLGNILLLLLIIIFMIRLVNSAGILTFYRERMFWVCCGLVLFYLGSLPFYGLWNTLANDYPAIFNQYWLIQMYLNYGMYLFFTIAFIWPNVK